MGFGTQLQGRISHRALIEVQDIEIKVLENIKRCMALRVESDRQYATSLAKVIAQAQKVDSSEFSDTLTFLKVWDNIVSESDVFLKQVRENADTLANKTLDTMTSIINEKKNMRRFYVEERNRLETDFTKLQEDVQKYKQEYCKTVERLKAEKIKCQELQSKGKGGSKVDEAKNKLNKTTIKLHRLHNDYVLSLREVEEHQSVYLGNTLPSYLDYQQAAQELLIYQSKFVLEEYHKLTDYSSSQYQRIFDKISSDIDSIVPATEYTKSFMDKYKSEQLTANVFEFDEKAIDCFSVSLQPNVLEVDDVTYESLLQRRTQLQSQMNECQKSLEIKTTRHKSLSVDLNRLETRLAVSKTTELVTEYSEKKKEFIILEKEMCETESNLQKLRNISDIISKPLDDLGDNNPPTLSNLLENGDLDTSSTLSTSSLTKKKKFVNLFRRRSESPPYNLENVTDTKKTKESNKKVGDGYEQHDLDSPNGTTSPSSPRLKPDNSVDIHVDFSDLPVRLQDDECFHGVLPREEVQRLLNNDGDYLIRESKNKRTNEVQYVLSVYWEGYKHFIIQGSEGEWRFEGQSFPTISQLVKYQYSIGTPVTTKSQAILRNAIKREAWELMNDDITLEMKIGNGNFGEVYKGFFRPNNTVVAVKTCKDTLSEDQRKKFLQEGRILKQYDHPNIVEFIGIAASRQPVMIVMEFVSGGALLSYLRKQGRIHTKKQLTQMCVDAANGMSYLESKGCIHRDLAARNCLVGDNNVVKISDFGMSREEGEYHVSQGMKQIPIKWTAPEALNFGVYTSLCDVWSFGILMWEIFSFGVTPYTGTSNAQAREKIEDGYRMPPPAGTPDEIYTLMRRCWEYEPEKRPHFDEVFKTLSLFVNKL